MCSIERDRHSERALQGHRKQAPYSILCFLDLWKLPWDGFALAELLAPDLHGFPSASASVSEVDNSSEEDESSS